MARKPMYTTISRDGPFFARNPGKTFRANARSMMRAIAIEGQVDIIQQLLSGDSGRAPIRQLGDHVSAHVAAGVPYTPGKSQTGQIKVNVYVPNFGYSKREGQSLMAAYSRVERQTKAFSRTTRRLRSAKKLNVAELLRGIG